MAKLCDKLSYDGMEVKKNCYTQRADTVVLHSTISVDLNMKELMRLLIENHRLIDECTFHDFARQVAIIDNRKSYEKYFGGKKPDVEEDDWF